MGAEILVISERLSKGTLLKVTSELVGGCRLETLESPPAGSYKVTLSPEAWRALQGLRKRGEKVRDTLERVLLATS